MPFKNKKDRNKYSCIRQKKIREHRKSLELCITCGKPTENANYARCEKCRERIRINGMKGIKPKLTDKEKIYMLDVYKAFNIFPSQVYALKAVGKLPRTPRGEITKLFIQSLTEYILKTRNDIPSNALLLIEKLQKLNNWTMP